MAPKADPTTDKSAGPSKAYDATKIPQLTDVEKTRLIILLLHHNNPMEVADWAACTTMIGAASTDSHKKMCATTLKKLLAPDGETVNLAPGALGKTGITASGGGGKSGGSARKKRAKGNASAEDGAEADEEGSPTPAAKKKTPRKKAAKPKKKVAEEDEQAGDGEAEAEAEAGAEDTDDEMPTLSAKRQKLGDE